MFRFRSSGPGQRWVHVCKKKKKNADGVICFKASIGKAKKNNGVYEYKPQFYDFPAFWLNRPARTTGRPTASTATTRTAARRARS